MIDVKINHPSLYGILERFDSQEIRYKINLDKLCKKLDESIIDELIELYKFKSGKNVDPAARWSVLHLIPQEMDRFVDKCREAEKFDEEIANVEKQILEVNSLLSDFLFAY